ncbi:MAG TPA: FtsW/RodA/SpoVE family cell cycle protein [Acidimicrobiales bacterium]|nr:FtsW/RodA/SpoVE family cell cycle protein [Acidimicrobiales bacterium]
MAILAPAPSVSLPRRTDVSLRRLDWSILLTVAGLCGAGLIAIYSATGPIRRLGGLDPYYYMQRQALFMGVAVIVMMLAAVIDYRRLREWALFLFGVTTVLLLTVTILAETRSGIRAWFVIGPFQLQPSELAKVTLILVLASFVASDRGEDLPFPGFVRALGLMAIPLVILIYQPDVGTASVFVAITMAILLVAKANPRHIALVTGLALFSAVLVISTGSLPGYGISRLTTFVDQDQVATDDATEALLLQAQKSQEAIAGGELTGRGFMQGPLTKGGYVPEQHTDFVFSAVGEQFGLLGCAGILALYAILIVRVLRVAQISRDHLGSLLCCGVAAALLWHVFQNVGMTMGIMPITGIPLPFISYGGSSTIAFFAMIGLVQNVYLRRL